MIWVQVANTGEFIAVDPGLQVGLYGRNGARDTLIDVRTLASTVAPGALSEPVEFRVANWASYDSIFAVVDDPDAGSGSAVWGAAKECDEDDNTGTVDLSALCE